MMRKTVDQITVSDLKKWPVWEFCNDDIPDETAMSPIKQLPVDHLNGRVVACEMTLANGNQIIGSISNIDVRNLRATQQFLFVVIHKDDKKFPLARYFDSDPKHSPAELAKFLKLSINDVFPISYDISKFVKAPMDIVKGQIPAVPYEKLSREELLQLTML